MVRQRHRQVEREGGNTEDLKAATKKKARKDEEGSGTMYLMAGLVSLLAVAYFVYQGYLETRVNTPLDHPKVRQNNTSGLLILTGRPVDQPAGRPAFLSISAGQNWPKLKMFRK